MSAANEFEDRQAEINRQIAEERQERITHFRGIIKDNGGVSLYEARCLLSHTFPIGDALHRALAEVDGPKLGIERIESEIRLAYHQQGKNQLKPINASEKPDTWRYDVAKLIVWAEWTGVGVTEEAREVIDDQALLKAAEKQSKLHGNASRHSSKREKVLGAAMALLAHDPNAGRAGDGKVVGHSLADMIEQKSRLLFDDKEAPLSVASMARHINEWLRKFD